MTNNYNPCWKPPNRANAPYCLWGCRAFCDGCLPGDGVVLCAFVVALGLWPTTLQCLGGAYNPITHEAVTVTNDTYINQQVFGEWLNKIAQVYAHTGIPITLVLDNAMYQKCHSVTTRANVLGIELLYLPAYSPNLNLIERLWRFVKQQVLYSKHYDQFEVFKASIDDCLSQLSTRFKTQMQSLMTLQFPLFSTPTKTENLTV